MLYRIKLGKVVAGVVVEDGLITKAAPVFRWMQGKPMRDIRTWIEGRRPAGRVTLVDEGAKELEDDE